MKKLCYPLFALATLAMTNTSCSDELENGAVNNSNEATVSFNLQLENTVGSRTIGDGETAKELHYAVYKAIEVREGQPAIGDEIANLRCEGTTIISDKTAEVKLTLVKGQTYNFFFWAQCPDGEKYYTIDYVKGEVKVNYSDNTETADEDEGRANNEERDAFFKVRKALKVNGPIEETITLKRPFAQINVGTEIGSLAKSTNAEVWIQKSNFVVKNAANLLDVYTGAATGDEEVTFNWNDIPETNKDDQEGDLKNVDDKEYEYLTMNYILVADGTHEGEGTDVLPGEGKQMINGTFNIYGSQLGAEEETDAEPINSIEIPNLPVQRNWRTNIIGNILNETVTFNIVIDNEFDNDHNYITEKEVAYAFSSGGEVTLDADVTITRPLYAVWSRAENEPVKEITNKTIIVNLNGKTLTYTGDDIMARLGEGATVTFNGPGKVVSSDYIASANKGGTIIINDGEYSGETCTLFNANGGKIYVKDGMFSNTDETNKATYLFNHIDAEKNNGLIEITGGTFVGFNPAASTSESPAMNFVKYGYTVQEVTAESNTWRVVQNELEQVTMKGGVFQLPEGGITLARPMVVSKDMILDLNGQTIKNGVFSYTDTDAIIVKEGATLTINGEGTVEAVSGSDGYAVISEGTVIINNGTFKAGVDAQNEANAVIYARGNGKVYVNGGNFPNENNSTYVLNKKDADRKTTIIEVTGGTFTGFDPADNAAENPKENFVVDGYESTKVGDNYVVTVKTAAENETVTLTSNGIITNSIEVAGGILDGNGFTLTQSVTPETNYLVHTEGAATIKNLNIVGANVAWMDGTTARGPRAIMIEKLNGDVVIDNVETSGVCYALNVNASSATKESNLIVKNSVLRGWTSYGSGLNSAKFSNVTFAVGNYFTAGEDEQSNGYMRPYVATRLESCSFEEGFKIDAFHQATDKNGVVTATYQPVIEIKNCKLNGVAITAENLAALFDDEATELTNVKIIK